MKAALIGIAGGTGAGKSAIVRGLVERLGGCVLDVDSYYRDLGHLTTAERAGHNYDEPAAIECPLLIEHLRRLARGNPVLKPVYSYETHTRVGAETVTPARLILVEGLFTLWWPELRALLDLKVFVDAPADLLLLRRIRRDVRERGRDVESVLAQYFSTVRPMHERYVEPTKSYADLVIANAGVLEDCLAPVLTAIRALAGGQEPGLAAGIATRRPAISDSAVSEREGTGR